MRWSDIDLDARSCRWRQARVAYGKLHVTKEPKTARSRRQIPLSPVAVEALRTHGTRQKREKPATGPTYARTMAWRSPTRLATRSTRRPSRPTYCRLVRDAGLPRIALPRREALVRHGRARGGR